MTTITKPGRELEFSPERLEKFITNVTNEFPHLDAQDFIESVIDAIEGREEFPAEKITNMLVTNASEMTSKEEPDWTFVAARFYLKKLYKDAGRNRCYNEKERYGSLYGLLKLLGNEGIYHQELLRDYTEEEINELESVIDPDKDFLFNYLGLKIIEEKYLATNHNFDIYELPQERFMVIAMWIMKNERPEYRLGYVKEMYWALSNHYMTVATPSFANAGKSYGQLSSCFIQTVDDDLRSIYDENTNSAMLSKNGGGIGVYMGKVRSLGSDIKKFKGVGGGVIPWIKGINQTAVAVDQLGQRKGAIAVYLDAWHKDINDFLDLKLNTGDERKRAHDIFLGVCLPDLFMEKVESRSEWYLFDPHEIRSKKGWSLEDFYDEEEGTGSFRDKYNELVADNEISKKVVPAIDIMKRIMKSQLQKGVPFMFYRDEANRKNANSHQGMIYCPNLCTEITQNQSPSQYIGEHIDPETGVITVEKKSGEMVVCNLSSINLFRAIDDDILDRLISIQVRALDNVIDLNRLPVPEAEYTNKRYRSIGLGTFGWHQLLAEKGIRWESDKAVEYCDSLYEEIAYQTIKASNDLAKEKGSYPLFYGSDWESGTYFDKRGYDSEKWNSLKEDVKANGIRNSYLMAVAPNATTALVVGSTASIDPIFKQEFVEEKKKYRIKVTAPNIGPKNALLYRTAFTLDQHWSIKQNARRQKHVDQSISFNFYVPDEIKAVDLLALHMDAWKSKLKTTYYVRSLSQEKIDNECESCSS